MTEVRIAAATSAFGLPFRKALHMASTTGVAGVQLDLRDELRPVDMTGTAVRQVRKLLEETNLRVAGSVFPTRRGLLFPAELERRLAAVCAALEATSKLGGRTLSTNLGEIPAADSPARSEARDALAILGAAGQRLGVLPALAAENADTAAVGALLSELPEGTLGLEFNPAALIAAGKTPSEWLAAAGPQVVHFRATDAARGLGGARTIEVELGRGVAEPHELAARLTEEFNYRGWATVGRQGAPDPAAEIGDAVAYLRSSLG